MSFSESYGKGCRELYEYDEAPVTIGRRGTPSGSSPSAGATDRSSTQFPSEMSMDLSDLQDVLREEDCTNKLTRGSTYSNNSLSCDINDIWHKQQNQEEDVNSNDEDDDGDGFSNFRSYDRGVNSSIIQFDEISEEFFQESDSNNFSSSHALSSPLSPEKHRQDDQTQHLSTVDEQDETSSESSMPTSLASQGSSSRSAFHSSNGSLNGRRKVKFEISTRLEDIQEYEKPDVEDYHMLYYTAHELQKMIDGYRAEEQRKRRAAR